MNRLGQHLAYIIYQAGAEDDLKLIPGYKYSFYKVHIFNASDLCLIIVLQDKAQTRRTVRHSENIFPSSGKPDDFRGYGFIAFPFFCIHF